MLEKELDKYPESWNSTTGSSSEMELMETFIQLDTRDAGRLKEAVRLEPCQLPVLADGVALRDLSGGRLGPLDESPILTGPMFSSIVAVFVARRASFVPLRLRSMVSMCGWYWFDAEAEEQRVAMWRRGKCLDHTPTGELNEYKVELSAFWKKVKLS